MAVDFSLLPAEQPVPEKGPSRVVWSLIFVAMTLTGAALSVWLWPRNETTQTLWFWFCVGVSPACVAGALVLRRFSLFHGWRNQLLAENQVARAYKDAVFKAAGRPLAVLAAQYRIDADDEMNTLQALLARGVEPPICTARLSRESIVASYLEPDSAALTFDDEERQGAVLEWILGAFTTAACEALEDVPARIPVAVRLDIHSTVLSHDAVLAVWDGLPSSALRSRLCGAPVMESGGGIWQIDTMLDQQLAEPRDILTLLISVNLSSLYADVPEPESTEAACMMLLCPEPLARRKNLAVAGWMHRPQATAGCTPEEAAQYALQWGGIGREEVGGALQYGFGKSASPLRVVLAGDQLTDHVLDTAIGNASATSSWLTAVLALEQASLKARPFIVGVMHDEQTLFAVVKPESDHAPQNVSEDA